jgi:hypothetical protein
MRNFKNVLTIALFLMGATLFAQTKLSGKVVDENNMALPGADVVIKELQKELTLILMANSVLNVNTRLEL